jgi:pimeloyl-ACP methyl ester carboxylesterase
VVVGHSFGAHNVRLFAASHLAAIQGIVLVEPAHEEMHERLPTSYASARARRHKTMRTMRFMAKTGLLHVVRALLPRSAPALAKVTLGDLRVRRFDTALAEIDAFPISNAQLKRVPSLGDVPVVVLAAERSVATFAPRDFPRGTDLDEVRARWRELLDDLATRSTRGSVRIVPNSGHHIPLEQPQSVVEAIRQLVAPCYDAK